jgi:hypothetical protein
MIISRIPLDDFKYSSNIKYNLGGNIYYNEKILKNPTIEYQNISTSVKTIMDDKETIMIKPLNHPSKCGFKDIDITNFHRENIMTTIINKSNYEQFIGDSLTSQKCWAILNNSNTSDTCRYDC